MIKRILLAIFRFTWKQIGVKHICMVQRKDHYIYCDYHGKIWKIEPTFNYNDPLRISLIDQP